MGQRYYIETGCYLWGIYQTWSADILSSLFSHFSCYGRFAFYSFLAFVLLTSSVYQGISVDSYMVELNKALKNKALTNFAFRNLTMKTVVESFFACLEDCLCLSFQMCNETECQLLSSTQFQSPLDIMMECTYYDMRPSATQQVRYLHCTCLAF